MRICFLDSGTGGLINLCNVCKKLPDEVLHAFEFFHIGDTQNIPYGKKTPDEITQLSIDLINKARQYNVDYFVIACNTICSINQSDIVEKKDEFVQLQKFINLNILTKTIDFVKKEKTDFKNILILATKRTVDSGIYKRELEESGFVVDQFDPSNWVEAIESESYEELKKIVEKDLTYFSNKKIDAILLACTHFEVIADIIKSYFNGVEVINQSDVVANDLIDIFNSGGFKKSKNSLTVTTYNNRTTNNSVKSYVEDILSVKKLTLKEEIE